MRNAIPRVAGDIPERDVPPLSTRQALEPRPGGEFEQERVVRHVRDSGFGARVRFRVPGSGFRGSSGSGFRVRGFLAAARRRTETALGTTGTERLRSSLQTCPVSNFSSSTPVRAIAAGKSRRMRGRCKERSIARCVRCPGGGNSSCMGQVEPMPASMRSPRSRTWSCTRTCHRNRCAERSTTSCRPIFTSAQSRKRRIGSTPDTTRVARCYLYQISRRRTAFGKPYVWWIRESLDVGTMRAAAAVVCRDEELRGLHGRRSRREIDARPRRLRRHRGGRRTAARQDPGLALPVEDGPSDGWRPGGVRTRGTQRARRGGIPGGQLERTQPLPRLSPHLPPACSSKQCYTKGTRHQGRCAP